MKRGRYRVEYERDPSGKWLVRIPSVPGCHTYGRTLDQARRRVREALSLWVDDSETAALVDDVLLPRPAKEAIRLSQSARRKARAQRARAQAATAEAARRLVEEGQLGLRDAAELLGLSHQRVQQLLASAPPVDDDFAEDVRASRREVGPPKPVWPS